MQLHWYISVCTMIDRQGRREGQQSKNIENVENSNAISNLRFQKHAYLKAVLGFPRSCRENKPVSEGSGQSEEKLDGFESTNNASRSL